MRIQTPENEYFLLPRELLSKLPAASGAELKVLLYLYAWKDASVPQLTSQLKLTPSEVEGALAFWRGAGLLVEDESLPKKPVPQSTSLFRNYDSDTIRDALDASAPFKATCDTVAELLGKCQLTRNDYSSLLYLCDYVGLPPELVSGIAAFCVSEGHKSLQFIMKTALRMYEDENIDTYEKFEAKMERVKKRRSSEGKLRKLCGFGERELTTKEQTLTTRWFEEWELSDELIALAYEKTVDSLGKVSLSYMNTILKRWYERGFTTPEDVSEKDSKPKGEQSVAGYGDSDEFFEAALKAGFEEA